MEFAVTIVGLPNMTMGQVAEVLVENNQAHFHVDDAEWPANQQPPCNWNVQFQGQFVNLTSTTNETYGILLTYPEIHRPKRRYQWFQENGQDLRPYRERINEFGKETFFFSDGQSTWGAIFASPKGDDAKRVVRDLLVPHVNVDQRPDTFTVPDDMIYWLLHRFLGNQRQIGTVQLHDVRGYFGESANGHKIRGQGARITTHLSTLGLVAENEPLRAVEIEAIVGANRVVFAMLEDGSCVIDENSRCGFARVPNTHDQQLLLTIFVYTKVLPILKSRFQEAVRTGAWNQQARLTFVQGVAQNLSRLALARVAPQPPLAN